MSSNSSGGIEGCSFSPIFWFELPCNYHRFKSPSKKKKKRKSTAHKNSIHELTGIYYSSQDSSYCHSYYQPILTTYRM